MSAPSELLVRIERGARYITPSGRTVRWVPLARETSPWLTFEYVDARWTRDQLTLSPANAQRLLKRVECVGAAA
jgi:hypothetical protein